MLFLQDGVLCLRAITSCLQEQHNSALLLHDSRISACQSLTSISCRQLHLAMRQAKQLLAGQLN